MQLSEGSFEILIFPLSNYSSSNRNQINKKKFRDREWDVYFNIVALYEGKITLCIKNIEIK